MWYIDGNSGRKQLSSFQSGFLCGFATVGEKSCVCPELSAASSGERTPRTRLYLAGGMAPASLRKPINELADRKELPVGRVAGTTEH